MANDLLTDIDPDDNFFNEIYNSLSQFQQSQYYTIDNYNAQYSDAHLSILSMNIRSFNANIEAFVSLLHSLQRQPDIIILTETWITKDNEGSCNIEGYHSYHTTRKGGRGGGVSAFCHNSLNTQYIQQGSIINNTVESCMVQVINKEHNITVLGIYRPHSDVIQNFTEEVERLLLNNTNPCQNVILIGDFNINLLDINNASIENFHTALQSMHFLPTITKPTRFPPTSVPSVPTLLDHIWSNRLHDHSSGILLSDITDHCPVSIHLYNFKNPNNKTKVTFRIHKQEYINKFLEETAQVNWEFNGETCVNTLMSNFNATLNTLYCRNFPLKTKYIGTKRLMKPWITPGIMKSIKTKSSYFKLLKLGLITKQFNDNYRNKLTTIIRKSKLTFYSKAFENCKSNMKQTWSLIKNIANNSNDRISIKKILIDDVEITSEPRMAEVFNEYFANVAIRLDSNIPHYPKLATDYIDGSVCHSLFLRPIKSGECSKIIENLKNTSNNNNTLPVKLFKLAKNFLLHPLCYIINLSIESGIFPDILKHANITPVYKNGDRHCISNYRPISVLPFLGKILEKCIALRLVNFMQKYNIITPNQYGFQKGRSTADAILKLMEYIYNALNEKKHNLTVFVDLRKAFDTVNHEILLSKLYQYGIRGIALDWFTSYLRDRNQCVRIGESLSSARALNIGVPQGSILGPVLFTIYINDLPNASALMSSILFADDTTLTMEHADYNELTQQINSELENIKIWTTVNRLSLNVSKTYAMLFSNRNPNRVNLPILFNGENVEFKDAGVFLGVTLDRELRFDKHINSVCKKISKTIGLLYKIRQFVSVNTMKNLYYTLIYPYLIYCNIIWGGTYVTHLAPLITLQKKIVRIITSQSYLAHTDLLFKQTGILKIQDIHKYLLGIYMFKNKIKNNLPYPAHDHNTRGSNNVLVAFQRLSLTQHSIDYEAPLFWNSLPLDIKNSSSLYIFKKALKQYLIHN